MGAAAGLIQFGCPDNDGLEHLDLLWRAMVARRSRRISSSVLPQNIAPVTTSMEPVVCFMHGRFYQDSWPCSMIMQAKGRGPQIERKMRAETNGRGLTARQE